MLVAGIDIGSNAVRLTVAKAPKKGDFHKPEDFITKYRFPCRLGDDVFKTGSIGLEKIERLNAIFSEIELLIEQHEIKKTYGVATSAFRDADNGSKVMNDLTTKHPKISCKVISGHEEASLMSEGLLKRDTFVDSHSHLHADIGGGSLELSYFHEKSFIFQESLDLGTLRLIEGTQCGSLVKDHLKKLSAIDELLKKHLGNKSLQNIKFHGTGGNFKRLGTLRRHSFNETNDNFLQASDISKMIEEYSKFQGEELSNHTPIKKDNAALIIPSLLIIDRILNFWPSKRIEISELSLSHVLIDKLTG